jgi:hypothetical protein
MLTYKIAVIKSIRVWQYLYDHPEIYTKELLPEKLYATIENYRSKCPLCEFFNDRSTHVNYRGEYSFDGCNMYKDGKPVIVCPLCKQVGYGYACYSFGHPYRLWQCALNASDRKEAAKKILAMLQRALVEEESRA